MNHIAACWYGVAALAILSCFRSFHSLTAAIVLLVLYYTLDAAPV
jgi:hypothetical protein